MTGTPVHNSVLPICFQYHIMCCLYYICGRYGHKCRGSYHWLGKIERMWPGQGQFEKLLETLFCESNRKPDDTNEMNEWKRIDLKSGPDLTGGRPGAQFT